MSELTKLSAPTIALSPIVTPPRDHRVRADADAAPDLRRQALGLLGSHRGRPLQPIVSVDLDAGRDRAEVKVAEQTVAAYEGVEMRPSRGFPEPLDDTHLIARGHESR